MPDAMKYVGKLAGQRVLVIGGTSGIGFGIAEALVEHGSEVIISSSNNTKLQQAISRLETNYPSKRDSIKGFTCNLSTPQASDEVANLFARAGLLDHVVMTAGDSVPIKPVESYTLAEMHQAGMVRFFGAILVAQQLKRHLKDGPHSSFIMTNGSVTDKPIKNWSIINGFLSGMEGLMRGFAFDLAPIRVNVVSPGPVDTELLWDAFKDRGVHEQAVRSFGKGALTGEIGRIENVVEAYIYLLKDENVTGSTVATNGGMYIR